LRGRYDMVLQFLASHPGCNNAAIEAHLADQSLKDIEGFALEDLAAQLYEERRSRLGLGDFALSERIRGYWDRSDVEIDLVAVSEEQKTIRFGSCKRQAERLPGSMPGLAVAAERFLDAHKIYQGWNVEYVAIAPAITGLQSLEIRRQGAIPQSLVDLCGEL